MRLLRHGILFGLVFLCATPAAANVYYYETHAFSNYSSCTPRITTATMNDGVWGYVDSEDFSGDSTGSGPMLGDVVGPSNGKASRAYQTTGPNSSEGPDGTFVLTSTNICSVKFTWSNDVVGAAKADCQVLSGGVACATQVVQGNTDWGSLFSAPTLAGLIDAETGDQSSKSWTYQFFICDTVDDCYNRSLGGDSHTWHGPPAATIPLQAESGNGQTRTFDVPLNFDPVAVSLVNGGAPLSGVPVTFTCISPAGVTCSFASNQSSSVQVATGPSGVANAGGFSVQGGVGSVVIVATSPGYVGTSFSQMVVQGLAIRSGDQQTRAQGTGNSTAIFDSLVVSARLPNGAPRPGVSVTFHCQPSGLQCFLNGQSNDQVIATDANGLAKLNFVSTSPGSGTLTVLASVKDAGWAPAKFTLSVEAPVQSPIPVVFPP